MYFIQNLLTSGNYITYNYIIVWSLAHLCSMPFLKKAIRFKCLKIFFNVYRSTIKSMQVPTLLIPSYLFSQIATYLIFSKL